MTEVVEDLERDRRAEVMSSSFIIVATDSDGGIGFDGRIPWRSSADMAHFRAATLGCALVVGRRTYEGLPKAMPGRTIVVVTSGPLPPGPPALAASSVSEAVELALDSGAAGIAFAGGTRIYEEAFGIPWVREAVVTVVSGRYETDTLFPALGPDWEKTSEQDLPRTPDQPNAVVQTWTRLRTA